MTRAERVEELIREEVCEILREKVFDPRIGFVSVTGVKISPDLKNASIFVSIFGEEEKKEAAMQGLNSATGFVRRELGKLLTLRATPQIGFVRDDSIERGSRVLNILSNLKNEEHTGKDKKSSKKR